MPRVEDATDHIVSDSSYGPGDAVARVVKTKGAKVISPGMRAVLDRIEQSSDNTCGPWSRALAYALPWKYATKTEHANFVRLVKGGHVRVCRVWAKAPAGSRAANETPYQNDYYVMRTGTCPSEVPEGTLRGSSRRRLPRGRKAR